MTYPHQEKIENEKPKMTTFKFTLHDGTGGTYRTDTAKTDDEALNELQIKYGVRVATVTQRLN